MERETSYFEYECRVEQREDGGHKISGYAAVFGSRTDLGGFTEEIQAGAFSGVVGKSDVRALFNHNPDYVLARSSSGTLRMKEDDQGLYYELDVPNTRTGTELVELIKRGDITGNSFSFSVEPGSDNEEWKPAEDKSDSPFPKMHRIIKRIKQLFDLGPVTFPAYDKTTVSARSEELARAEAEKRAAEQMKTLQDNRRRRLDLKGKAA